MSQKIILGFALLLMSGCAALPAHNGVKGESTRSSSVVDGVESESVYVTNQTEMKSEETEIITLECLAAHSLGCRFKGRLYPWNAWVEKKGYKASEYAIQDVQQAGNKAVVTLVKK